MWENRSQSILTTLLYFKSIENDINHLISLLLKQDINSIFYPFRGIQKRNRR